MATGDQTRPAPLRVLTFNLKTLARYASDAWGGTVNVPWLRAVTGLNERPTRGWWDVTTDRMELSTIGGWCNLFWCHPHELISWPETPIAPSAVRRPATSLDALLATKPIEPLPVVNHLPAQIATLEESNLSRRSLMRVADLSHFAALDSDATAITRHVLSRICRATSADVGDVLTVVFPPEAQIPPHQPRKLRDLLAPSPQMDKLPSDIQQAIAQLDADQRQIANLRYGLADGKTHALRAIAQQVGTSPEGVRQQISRLRSRLQKLAPASGTDLNSHLPEPPPSPWPNRLRPRE